MKISRTKTSMSWRTWTIWMKTRRSLSKLMNWMMTNWRRRIWKTTNSMTKLKMKMRSYKTPI